MVVFEIEAPTDGPSLTEFLRAELESAKIPVASKKEVSQPAACDAACRAKITQRLSAAGLTARIENRSGVCVTTLQLEVKGQPPLSRSEQGECATSALYDALARGIWPLLSGASMAGAPRNQAMVEVTQVIRANTAGYAPCAERARAASLRGEVTIRFVVAKSGEVVDSRVDSATLRDPSLSACLRGFVKGLRFSKREGVGRVPVTYTFRFGD